jgi:hypothetical protein
MRAARFPLAVSLIALAGLVPPVAHSASLGIGTVNVAVDLFNTDFAGELLFAPGTHDIFGTMFDAKTQTGDMNIVDGELVSFNALGNGGSFTVDMISKTAGRLQFTAAGSFLCNPSGCIGPGPHSLVGAVDSSSFTGTVVPSLPSNPPVTYTGDLSIGCTGTFPILSCTGPIGINAFQSVVTPEGTNVIVNAITTYYNSKASTEITLPITIEFTGVPTGGGLTLVTAASANGGTLPAGYVAQAPGFPASFFDVTTDFSPTPPIKLCVDYTDNDGDGIIDGTGPPGVKLANLRLLHGQGGVFGDFTITASIGTTQACAEVNTLSPFVVAIVPDATTTTTTLPGSCTQDADCADDGDPCFSEACSGGTCQSASVEGIPGATCVCRRPTAAACTGLVPANVNAQLKKACKSVTKAESSQGNAKKAKKLLKAASKTFKKAKGLATKAANKKKKPLAAACATALSAALTDAQQRMDRAGAGL